MRFSFLAAIVISALVGSSEAWVEKCDGATKFNGQMVSR